MGTRSTIAFIERSTNREGKVFETELVRIYQQFDGYPSGVGKELANWLNNKHIINGIPYGEDVSNCCNGIGCMTAQFIRDFKTDIGGLYITTNNDFEDYNYRVIEENDMITLEAYHWDDAKPFFRGTSKEFIDALNNGGFDD